MWKRKTHDHRNIPGIRLRRTARRRADLRSTPGMREVRATLEQALRDDLPVLIEGESGTGKEVIARFLHCHSARREKPFVKLNCGSVPARLLEGVMFAFEGNGSGGVGMLEHSLLGNPHDGTLFLDEVVDLDLSLRHKLTQALQVCRDRLPGEEKPLRPRVVCATSANLAARGSARFDS